MSNIFTKSFGWIAYGLILVGSVVWLSWNRQGNDQPYTAANTLPAGHRLETGDIVLPGAPQYLVQTVEAGKPVNPENLSNLLAADAPKDTLAVVLKFTAAGDSLPNTGDKLWICPAANKDPAATKEAQVVVLSAQCDRRIGTCLAVVALPATRAAAFAKLTKPQLSANQCAETPK